MPYNMCMLDAHSWSQTAYSIVLKTVWQSWKKCRSKCSHYRNCFHSGETRKLGLGETADCSSYILHVEVKMFLLPCRPIDTYLLCFGWLNQTAVWMYLVCPLQRLRMQQRTKMMQDLFSLIICELQLLEMYHNFCAKHVGWFEAEWEMQDSWQSRGAVIMYEVEALVIACY